MDTRNNNNRPVHEIRLGKIKAALWASSGEHGVRYNVTLSRVYRDGDAWKTSESFGREDLPLVAKVADMAHTWMYSHMQGNGTNANAPTDRGGFWEGVES